MRRYLSIVYILILGLSLSFCKENHNHEHAENKTQYTCSMHPQIIQDKPGTCPICGMDLVKLVQGSEEQGEIMLSESQRKLANIIVKNLSADNIDNSTILTGTIAINQQEIEMISSRVEGRIEKLFVKEVGQAIEKGKPLYKIYSEQLLTLQKEYLLAQQQYNAFKENKRYYSFFKAAEKKLILLGITEGQLKELAEGKEIEPTITIYGPSSGVVTEILSYEGTYVAEGGLLYKVAKLDPLWVEAQLYQNEASLVKQGEKVKVKVVGYENLPLTGTVVFISPEFTQGSQILNLRVKIPNKEKRYFPGMQANIILTRANKGVVSLPVDAVIREQNGNHVWVETKENIFQPRMVKTGMENYNEVEITGGLNKNEKVVVSGAYLLYSEFVLKKGGNPMQGHNHSSSLETIELSKSPEDKAENHENSPTIEEKSLVDPKFKKQIASFLNNYYKIKDALEESDDRKAATASEQTNKALENINPKLLKGETKEVWSKDSEDLRKNLISISSAKDIEKQRLEFASLSKTLRNTLKYFGVPSSEVYYQYCPMAFNNNGGYWLSEKEEIRNPFFGEKMLTCGEVKEVLR